MDDVDGAGDRLVRGVDGEEAGPLSKALALVRRGYCHQRQARSWPFLAVSC